MSQPTILLADDHPLICTAIQKLLPPEYNVIGCARDGRELVRMAIDLKPDLMLIDLALPLVNGLDAARQVKQRMPGIQLIFLTMNQDPDIAREAFRIGASGYVLKSAMADELLPAVRAAISKLQAES